MNKIKETNHKEEPNKELEIKEDLNIEKENEIEEKKDEKIENDDIIIDKIEKNDEEQSTDEFKDNDTTINEETDIKDDSSSIEEIDKENDKEKESTIIEDANKEENQSEPEISSEHEKFTIILTPKGYKYSEDGENIAYDEDAYRYNGEYEEDDIKEKRIANLNKALEGKIEKDEINFLQQYGDLSLAKIMSQYEKSNDIPKEYIEKIKALAKENKISIKYDLTKSSVLSRFASILKREKALDLDQIDELKAMAYNARGYAEIKASPMTKLSFKVKDMVRGSNQKMLGDGKEKKE